MTVSGTRDILFLLAFEKSGGLGVERENTSVVAKREREKTTGTHKVIEDDHFHTHTHNKNYYKTQQEDLF